MMPESATEPETGDLASPAYWPIWQPPPGLPEPAREVWLAGLGAFSRAQAEGGKAFQALVRQGLTLQTQASQVAQERIAEATQPWERLSGLNSIFEDRVARALARLGLPGPQDWAALQARVQTLEAALQDALRTIASTATAASAASPNHPVTATRKKTPAKSATPARAPAPTPARARPSPTRARARARTRAPSSKKPRTSALP